MIDTEAQQSVSNEEDVIEIDLDAYEPTPEELAEIERCGYSDDDEEDDQPQELEVPAEDASPKAKKFKTLVIKVVSYPPVKFKPKQSKVSSSRIGGGRTKADKDKARRDAVAAVIKDEARDAMTIYMSEISDLGRVSKQEEAVLSDAIRNGDEVAREDARATLIQANLRLVVKIAHDFKGYGLPITDLISEGNIGLMKAVEKFDPSKGAKFSSYASWWIKQAMRRAVANQSTTIRVPVQSASRMAKIRKARLTLTAELGRTPTDVEIARELDMSPRAVSSLMLSDLQTVSIHAPLKEGEVGEIQDYIPDRNTVTPDKAMYDVDAIFQLMDLLDQLPDRDRQVLELRFGLRGDRPMTLDEVSERIGRTRERVRQIQNSALDRLKEAATALGIVEELL